MYQQEMLAEANGKALLQVARHSLQVFVRRHTHWKPDLKELPAPLHRPGASFVTYTNLGSLRGCIGTTSAHLPLAEDVARNAASASHDPRFEPIGPAELADIRLEITVLTPPEPLPYTSYQNLLEQLRPGGMGVILTWKQRRGVLLPQVWQRLPDPARFLDVIARKAGIPQLVLQESRPQVAVETFQVQCFEEPGYREPGR